MKNTQQLKFGGKELHAPFSSPVLHVDGVLPAAEGPPVLIEGQSNDMPFTAMFQEMAQIFPDKVAVEFHEKTITYKELENRSNQFAAYLLEEEGIQDSIIGISLDRSIEMIVAMLGVIKAGNAYLPLDPSLPEDRLHYMLESARAKAVVTSSGLLRKFDLPIKRLALENVNVSLRRFPTLAPKTNISPDSLVYVLFTSGSTGKPKGVQISHKNLTNLLLSTKDAPGMQLDDRLLAITTISFDISVLELFLPLISGATVVLADSEAVKDGRQLLKLLTEKDITFMQATPVTWRMLTMAGWNAPLDLKILSGGEAFPKDLAFTLLGLCAEVWNGYGPTETTIYSTMKKISIEDEVITIGRAINHTGVYILDLHGLPVAEDEIGEIHISGDGVSSGYLGRPDLTQDRFVPNPYDQLHPIMYKTGDLGRWLPSGDIECLGRVDHQVKIRGFRIELGEIEQQLLASPLIKQAVVSPWENHPGNKRLAAYLVLHDPKNAKQQQFAELIKSWKAQLLKSLPEYMVPADWVAMKKLPLTANQKIDRKALPLPSLRPQKMAAGKAMPNSEMEKTLQEIWQHCLKIDQLSIDDNFFDLGGHSILAVALMTAVDQKTGIQLPLTTLFSYPTIREFAGLLESKMNGGTGEEDWASLVPIKTTGSKTPIYLVHGLAANAGTFFKLNNLLDAEQPIYGFQSKGLSGKEAPLTTVAEMAAHYTEELLAHRPSGPYILGGYSFGGYVAFEMAAILLEMGKEVTEVIMFDTQAVDMPMKDQRLSSSLEKIKALYGKKKVEYQVMVQAPQIFRRTKIRSIERKKERWLQKLHLAPKPTSEGRADVIQKVRDMNHRAMMAYVPKKLPLHVTVFKADIIPSKSKDDWANGWVEYCDKVTVIGTKGDHFTLFEEPFVNALGLKLKEHLG